jgi:hypothetical protein
LFTPKKGVRILNLQTKSLDFFLDFGDFFVFFPKKIFGFFGGIFQIFPDFPDFFGFGGFSGSFWIFLGCTIIL